MLLEHSKPEIYPVNFASLQEYLGFPPLFKPMDCYSLSDLRKESPFMDFFINSKIKHHHPSPEYFQGLECAFCTLNTALSQRGVKLDILEGEQAVQKGREHFRAGRFISDAQLLAEYIPTKCKSYRRQKELSQHFLVGVAGALSWIYSRGVIRDLTEQQLRFWPLSLVKHFI